MADKYNLTIGTTAQIQALVDGSELINGLQYHDSDLGIRYVATGVNTLVSIGADLWEVGDGVIIPKNTMPIEVTSANGVAISGASTGDGQGIFGFSNSGIAVYAQSSSGKAIQATSTSGDAVTCNSTTGKGLVGISSSDFGVYGSSESSYGVRGNTARFGSDTDNTTIEADGTIKFNGAATVFVDIDFPIIIRNTGANIPTLTTFNGNLIMPQWEVDDFNMCESKEFIHGWKEGSACNIHIHLNTNGTNTDNRYVKFNVEYAYSEAGVWIFPAAVTTADILIPANTPTKKQLIIPLVTFTPTNSKIGDHCLIRLRRVASTGNAPSANPWIPMVQLHVECDTVGSRTISDK